MRYILALVMTLALVSHGAAEESAALQLWAVDPLVKVFPDASPAPGDAIADAARGEVASLQVVARCPVLVKDLKMQVDPLVFLDGAGGSAPPLKPSAVRFVGFVPVDPGVAKPPSDRLRVPPAFYPDPLLEKTEAVVTAGTAQPIWVTVPIPTDAAPGLYRATLRVSATIDGKKVAASLPLQVRVWAAKLERSRLWVTNWFQLRSLPVISREGAIAGHGELKPDSDPYWTLLRRYARNMAAHRQNVALIPPLELAEFKAKPDGTLDIDFARFNRWVDIFIEEGVIGRIEGGHVGARERLGIEFVLNIRRVKDGKIESASVDPASADADAFYAQFFPALIANLKAKGWLDKYVQHLADEPIDTNIETYRSMAKLLRRHAPELRVIEACHTKNLTGSIQVWVPQLNFLHEGYEHYRERQKAGDEVWFYTCLGPAGEYANRFIEQPLIKTRLLHWINFRYGVTGYLHWGYNQWGSHDPYHQLAIPWDGGAQNLPAGDGWIVYPGKEGPLDSIRFEAMRDGIDDYELLRQLAERDREAAMQIAARYVVQFDKYDTDVKAFRETRRALLEKLSPR